MTLAQGGVQHRPPLGGVDGGTGEEAVSPALKVAGPSQVDEQTDGFGSDAIFGVIEQNAGGFETEASKAVGVGGEKAADRHLRQCPLVPYQSLPSRARGHRRHRLFSPQGLALAPTITFHPAWG